MVLIRVDSGVRFPISETIIDVFLFVILGNNKRILLLLQITQLCNVVTDSWLVAGNFLSAEKRFISLGEILLVPPMEEGNFELSHNIEGLLKTILPSGLFCNVPVMFPLLL